MSKGIPLDTRTIVRYDLNNRKTEQTDYRVENRFPRDRLILCWRLKSWFGPIPHQSCSIVVNSHAYK